MTESLRFEQVGRRLEPRFDAGDVAERGAHQLVGAFRVIGGLTAAEHVGRESGVAELGQLGGTAADIVVEAPPFVNHDNAGAVGRRRNGKVALEAGAPGLVAYVLGLDRHGILLLYIFRGRGPGVRDQGWWPSPAAKTQIKFPSSRGTRELHHP